MTLPPTGSAERPLAMPEVGADFDWALVRAFLAVARRGSLARAARDLGVSHPAARRQLGRIERVMGAPLFSRSPAGMALTPLGANLLTVGEEMERVAHSMMRVARSGGAGGLVRLAVDDALGPDLLRAIMRTLGERGPGIRLSMLPTSADLLRGQADVAIGFEAPVQARVVTSRVATLRMGLFASLDWIDANGQPDTLDALAASGLLLGDRCGLETLMGVHLATDAFRVTTSDQAQVWTLVQAGMGVGVMPTEMVATRRDLVRILPSISEERSVWLSVHPDLRRVPQVRLVLDVIRGVMARLAGERDGGEGRLSR